MFRLVAYVFLSVALVAGSPATVRTRKDIQEFQQFLDRVRKGNSEALPTRQRVQPQATPEEVSGRFQGDIVLDDEDYEIMLQEYAVGRNAYTASTITAWPDNVVVWAFADGVFNEEQQNAILAAIEEIESRTCVRFRYREATDNIYVKLTGASDGCYAHIGYRVSRGAHTMNLALNTIGTGCFRHATIVHEWMHILGFLHMHATFDRNEYVDIVSENILSGSEHNFDIYGPSNVDNLGVDYDYVSCLHYGPTSFTSNGQPTIVAKQTYEGTMGQRDYVTEKDWLRINRHYNCPGAWD